MHRRQLRNNHLVCLCRVGRLQQGVKVVQHCAPRASLYLLLIVVELCVLLSLCMPLHTWTAGDQAG